MSPHSLFSDQVGLDALTQAKPIDQWRVKMGFDPTSADLHLGHAVGLFALRELQNQGAQVLLVVGDFTASIGDPTGRNEARPSLDAAAIARNASTYAEQAFRILDPARTTTVFNSVWLDALGSRGMIALASQTTLAQMLAREDFARRFKAQAPIGAHELLYPLLQGHDSVHLRPELEVGGTDQRFNLLMGRELMRAQGLIPQACAMTPLLVGLDGVKKMSKSLGNHIGLTESPSDQFAKTMSVSDETMLQWMGALRVSAPQPGEHPLSAKKRLAFWIVERFHGRALAGEAQASWEASRQGGDWSSLAEPLSLDLPLDGKPWAAILRDLGWEASAAQARSRIAQGALRLDGSKIEDPSARALPGVAGLLRYGSKRAARLSSTPASS